MHKERDWNHNKRTLYTECYRIQKEAGIHLPCAKASQEGHVCNQTCHTYGFHAFRYAHARLNYQNPGLQNQMGHATSATTEHYKRWAGRQLAEYGAYVPDRLVSEDERKQRENSGKDDGKPKLRLFTA